MGTPDFQYSAILFNTVLFPIFRYQFKISNMIRFRHPHFPIIRLPAFSLRLFANININIAGTAVPKYLYGCALPVLVLRYPCYLYRLKFSSATARALPRPWYTCTTSTTLVKKSSVVKMLCSTVLVMKNDVR